MDPLELDDGADGYHLLQEGWTPWDLDDLIDIERIIEQRLPKNQKEIIQAFLIGKTYSDIGVTEKYWRYHYDQAIEFIKEELKL
jgi:hypothetical protein